jgi:hypothetical protein
VTEHSGATETITVERELAPTVRSFIEALRGHLKMARESGAEFRRKGAVWTIAYGDERFSLRDRVGLLYISYLLAHPGEPIPSLTLAAQNGEAELRLIRLHQPVLDSQARDEYSARLREIDLQLKASLNDGDSEQRASLVEQKEILQDQLRTTARLGRRPRTFPDNQERARVSVTKAIHAAVAEIGTYNADLACFLRLSIKTGASCTYRPAEEMKWKL